MTDYLESLPSDDHPINSNEKTILDQILKHDTTPGFYTLVNDLQVPLTAGMGFLMLNIPVVDEFIQHVVPYTKTSHTSLLLFKTMLFILLLFLISNLDLIKS